VKDDFVQENIVTEQVERIPDGRRLIGPDPVHFNRGFAIRCAKSELPLK
jgi:hypothetical protein